MGVHLKVISLCNTYKSCFFFPMNQAEYMHEKQVGQVMQSKSIHVPVMALMI